VRCQPLGTLVEISVRPQWTAVTLLPDERDPAPRRG
jgi:hypothetical protein